MPFVHRLYAVFPIAIVCWLAAERRANSTDGHLIRSMHSLQPASGSFVANGSPARLPNANWKIATPMRTWAQNSAHIDRTDTQRKQSGNSITIQWTVSCRRFFCQSISARFCCTFDEKRARHQDRADGIHCRTG